MQIESAAYLSIAAGGPGSGRHPGYGHGEMQKAVKGLNQRGWLAHSRPQGYTLTHPDLPGHTIRLKNNGKAGMSWHHWDHRLRHESGTNSHSLLQHESEHVTRHELVKKQTTLQKIVNVLKQLGPKEVLRDLMDPDAMAGHLGDLPDYSVDPNDIQAILPHLMEQIGKLHLHMSEEE